MNYVLLALATFASFMFIFCFDLLYHGILLKHQYDALAHLWRAPDDMTNFMTLAISIQFFLALLMTVIFAAFSQTTGFKAGFRYGALIGAILGAQQIGMYTFLPVPLELATAWFAGCFLNALGAGILIGLIYRRP